MQSTTIRVDRDTHERLVALSKRAGRQLIETVRLATEALETREFAHSVAAEYTALRARPHEWCDYMSEADSLGAGVDLD